MTLEAILEFFAYLWNYALYLMDVALHLDKHVGDLIRQYGVWTHLILFAIVFLETGVVVTPFLPGDSLLFVAGTFAALGDIDLLGVMALIFVAAVLGDTLNYHIGKWAGPEIFHKDTGRLLNKKHLVQAHDFYEKHGGKAIVLARFIPIVRTFAPFVAGIGKMNYRHFLAFNVLGGLVWVVSLVMCGYWFGNIPSVKANFSLVVAAIIVISVLPVVVEVVKIKWPRRRA